MVQIQARLHNDIYDKRRLQEMSATNVTRSAHGTLVMSWHRAHRLSPPAMCNIMRTQTSATVIHSFQLMWLK